MNTLLTIAVSVVILSVLTLPISQATTISVYYSTFPPVTATLPDLVDGLDQGQISVQQAGLDYNVIINVQNKTAQQLQILYLFKCKASDPVTCINDPSTVQESYTFTDSSLSLSIPWSSLRDSSTYPQRGNILIAIKTTNLYGGSWISSWHRFVRNDPTFNPPYHFTSDLPSIDVTVPSIEERETVKTFVEQYAMLPMTNIQTVTFPGVSSIHELTGANPPTLSGILTPGNQISVIPQLFDFVLPDGNKNGITLTQNPTYTPGDGFCDIENGENSANSCYDCGCSSGQYCDMSQGCMLTSGVNLEVIPPTNTQVANCNIENTVTVTLRLNSPPSDLSITSQAYVLDGTTQFSLGCSVSGNIYTCQITVPAEPGCDAGSYVHSQNSIIFDVTYSDGPTQISRQLVTSFPDITVGSWTCGDGLCEASLGESSVNCCYDCSCSTGQYCDVSGGPETGICYQSLSDSSLFISNVSPSSFLTHSSAGNTVTFDYQVLLPPQTLSLGEESCSIDCTSEEACEAPCSISCVQSSGGTCSLTFTIANYDQFEGYSLDSIVSVPVSYMDGPTLVNDVLQGALPTFDFAPFSCGDLVCNSPVETIENCCFDCGCSSGEYCNTADTNEASSKDICTIDDISFVVDSFGETSFVNSDVSHNTSLAFHITNIPAGFQIYDGLQCDLLGGLIPCVTTCSPVSGDEPTSYYQSCQVIIPSIVYYLSSAFDPVTKQILLTDNSISMSIGFNNGSVVSTRYLNASIPDITITPLPTCGNFLCEDILGESAVNCCIDCPCANSSSYGSDYVCIPGGSIVNSTCLPKTTIQLDVTDIAPDTTTCEIMPPTIGSNCVFVDLVRFTLNVSNAPDDLILLNAFYKLDGGDDLSPIACLSQGHGSWECSISLDTIEGSDPIFGGGTLTPRDISTLISWFFDMSYTDNAVSLPITTQLTTDYTFIQSLVKSDALASCEDKREDYHETISEQKKVKSIVVGIVAVIAAITIAGCVCCAAKLCDWGSACIVCNYGLLALVCFGSILVPLYGSTEAEIDRIEAKNDALCKADTSSGIADSVIDTGQLAYQVAGMTLGFICAAGVANGGFGIGGGSSAATTSGALELPANSAAIAESSSGSGVVLPPK